MGLNDVPANIGVEDVGQRIILPISSPNIHVTRFSLSIGGVFHIIHFMIGKCEGGYLSDVFDADVGWYVI